MPAANAPMPVPPAPERLRSPAGRSEPQADVLPEAPPKKKDRAGVELGCFGERWHRKCSREAVVQDLGDGCSKNCGCVWSLAIAEVRGREHLKDSGFAVCQVPRSFMRFFDAERPLTCREPSPKHTIGVCVSHVSPLAGVSKSTSVFVIGFCVSHVSPLVGVSKSTSVFVS